MANSIRGRLVFNAHNKIWYLTEMTGSSNCLAINSVQSVSAMTVLNSSHSSSVSFEQASLRHNGRSLAPSSFHFGRLGYYARADKWAQHSVSIKPLHSMRAGFAGVGLAVMSSTALVNPTFAGNILPTGGVVTTGSGTINSINNGAGLKINQTTQVLGLNWNSFSIGAGNTVIFEQPNSTSVAINRVIGNNRSEIFGSIQANGQVILLNPNGVLIARTAQIDTGAFIAAAAQDVRRDATGAWVLSGISDASVVNQGAIRSDGQGGFVVLAGAQVSNEGRLQASAGVALAVGETVSLALDNNQMLSVKVDGAKLKALVENKGLILANGGAVYLTAAGRNTLLGTVVNNEGIIQAQGIANKQGRIILSGVGGDTVNTGTLDVSGKVKGAKGGLVVLSGNRVAVVDKAVIDASGNAGGGRVIIGGDLLGKASDVIKVALSDKTIIGLNAFINISASDGDGGFVETSGHALSMQGTVIGKSIGKAGQWLIDPNDVIISTGTAANMSGNPFTPSSTDNGIVNNGSIQSALNSGLDVTVTTAGSGSATGNITWASGNISKTTGGAANLTLVANGSITLNGINITSSSNALDVNLSASQSGDGVITLNNTIINTNSGNLTGSATSLAGIAIVLNGTNTLTLGSGNGLLSGNSSSNTAFALNVSGTLNANIAAGYTLNISGNAIGTGGGANVGGIFNLTGGGDLNVMGVSSAAVSLYLNNLTTNIASGNLSIMGNYTGSSGAYNAFYQGYHTVTANVASGTNLYLTGKSASSDVAASGFGGTTNISGGGNVTFIGNSTGNDGIALFSWNMSVQNSNLKIFGNTSATDFAGITQGFATILSTDVASNATMAIVGNSTVSGTGILLTYAINKTGNGNMTIQGNSNSGTGITIGTTNFSVQSGNLAITGNSFGNTGTSWGVKSNNNSINANIATGSILNISGYSNSTNSSAMAVGGDIALSGGGNLIYYANSSVQTSLYSYSLNATVSGGNLSFTGNSSSGKGTVFSGGAVLNASVDAGSSLAFVGNSMASSTGLYLPAAINVQSGLGLITLQGNSASGIGVSTNGELNLTVNSGNLNITGVTNSTSSALNIGNLITANIALGSSVNLIANSTSNASGVSFLNNTGINLQAGGGGNLNVNANTSSGTAILFSGTTNLTALSGNISMNGKAAANWGFISGSNLINANIASGSNIQITGCSTSTSFSATTLGGTLNLTGGGNISIAGNSSGNVGMWLQGLNANVQSGNLILNGTAASSTGINDVGTIVANVATNANVYLNGNSTGGGTGLNLANNPITLLGGGNMTMAGQSLSGAGAFISATNNVTVQSGKLDISGTSTNSFGLKQTGIVNAVVAVAAAFNLTGTSTSFTGYEFNGGTINVTAGSGNVTGGGAVAVAGYSTTGGGLFFGGTESISHQSGSLTFSGTSTGAGSNAMGVNHNGVVTTNIATGLTVNITGTSTSSYGFQSAGTLNLTGGGTMAFTGNSTSNVGVSINGTDNFNVQSGVLKIIGNTANTTAFNSSNASNIINGNAASGAIINISGTATGTGVGALLGGTVNMTGAGTFNIAGISTNSSGLSSGTLNITATNGNLNLSGKSANSTGLNTSGTLIASITAGATVALYGNATGNGIGSNILNTITQTGGGNLIVTGTTATNITGLNIGAAITAASDLLLSTQNGNLLLNGNIQSTAGNVTMAAGTAYGVAATSVANGSVLGGDIVKGTATSIAAGAGKTVILYSGNTNTTNLASLVANATTSQYKNYATSAYNGAVNISRSLNIFYRISPVLTITGAAATNKIYDGTTDAIITGTFSGSIDGDAITVNATSNFVSKNAANNISVNTVGTVIGVVTGNANLTKTGYQFTAIPTLTANITQKALTVTASSQSRGYDGGTTVSNASGFTTSGLVAGENISAVTLAYTDKNVGAGTKTIVVNGAVAGAGTLVGNYNITYVSNTSSTITAKALTITAGDQSKTYDGGTSVSNVSGFATSGLVAGEAIAAVTLGYADKNAGSANKTILVNTAVAGANTSLGNYNITYVNSTASTITRKTLIIAAGDQAKTYDGCTSVSNVSNFTTTGLVSGEGVSNVTLAYTDKNVGAANKTITISNAQGDSNTLINNYNINYVNSTTSTIGKAELTVAANNDAKFVTQNDNTSYKGLSYSGFVGGEVLSNSGVSSGGITRTNANQSAGNYSGVLVVSGVTSNNYNITAVAGNYTIVPADQLLISVNNINTTYGSTANYSIQSAQYLNSTTGVIANLTLQNTASNIYTLSDGVGGQVSFSVDPTAGSYSGSNTLKVGSYQLTSGNSTIIGNNFNALILTGAVNVVQKQVTGSAANVSKTYDGNTLIQNTSLNISGVLSGDNVSAQGNGNFVTKSAGTNKSYSMSNATLSGNDSNNYYINYTSVYNDNNGVINKTTITNITNIAILNKIYDGTTNATFNVNSANLTGIIAGDNLVLTGGAAQFANKNVGLNTSVNITGLVLSGTDAGNYNLAVGQSNYSGFANITSASIIVRALDQIKTYDGNLNVSNQSAFSVSGLVAGENISGVTLAYINKDFGLNNKVVTITNAVAGAGTLMANYIANYVDSTTSSVTLAKLIIAATNQTKTYDGSTVANQSAFTTTGLATGENISGVNLVYANKTAGYANKVIEINYAVASANTSLSNYDIVYQNNTTSTISPLTVTGFNGITANNKTYDGTRTATLNITAASITGILAGDQVNLSGASGLFNDANVGNTKSVTISNMILAGFDAVNYATTGITSTVYANITSPISVGSDIIRDKKYNAFIYHSLNKNDANHDNIAIVSDMDLLNIVNFKAYTRRKNNNYQKDQAIDLRNNGVNKN